jgi:sugar/nucleoside kinase (ribokinase family)
MFANVIEGNYAGAAAIKDAPAEIPSAATLAALDNLGLPSVRRALGVSADASPDAIKQAAEHQIIVCIATDDRPADPRHTERV